MKTAIAILPIATAAHAVEVMQWDGTTRKGPMRLPTSAQTATDGRTISKITTEADANACGYYRIQRATPDAGNRIVSSEWELVGNVFVEKITEQANIAEEWAQANQKTAENLIMEQQLKAVLDGLGTKYPIPEGALPTIISKAEQWIAASKDADTKGDRRQTLLKVVAIWTKLGDAVYAPTFGRQVVKEDMP